MATEPWDVKLDRARELIGELHLSIQVLRDSDDFRTVATREGNDFVFRLAVKHEPPARLSAIVGDVIHNVHSALDCTAVATSRASSTEPLSDDAEQSVQFPITWNRSHFNQSLSKWLMPPTIALAGVMRRHQPWFGPEQATVLTDETRRSAIRHDPLMTINELSRIDKHRRILLTAWYPEPGWIGLPDGVTADWVGGTDPWVDGAEVGRWMCAGDHLDQVDPPVGMAIGLMLKRNADFGWHPIEVTDTLRGLLRSARAAVDDVVRAIRSG